MAKLIIKSTENTAQFIELKPGLNRFGRSSFNDHLVVDPGVSERHCEILVDGDFVIVRDLDSTNGTFINQKPVKESALYAGQVLQIGPVEMVLDAPQVRLSLPELPSPTKPALMIPTSLKDGYAACLSHAGRHAVWECNDCHRFYCDQCIRKLRRVGGAFIKLCPACSHTCRLSPWAEMLRNKKRGILGKLVGKIKSSFKHTRKLFARDSLPPAAPPQPQP
jgi:hypothetical protein